MSASCRKWIDGLQFSSLFWPPPQDELQRQMGKTGEELDIDFVISAGDNFYENGLTGVDDNAFEESFSNIYTAKSLQKPWYLLLGNHDYRGDVLAQLNPVLPKIDSRFICMRSFIVSVVARVSAPPGLPHGSWRRATRLPVSFFPARGPSTTENLLELQTGFDMLRSSLGSDNPRFL